MNERAAPSWREQLQAAGVALEVPRRVLLVDDEPDNLVLLGMALEDEHQVYTAGSGAEALALHERVPDIAVVVSDQRMPGMSGIELLAELARRAPHTVRMVVTAHADVEPIVAAVNEGSAYRFFLKPWNVDEMRTAIADAMRLYEARLALPRVVELLGRRKAELASTLASLRRSQNDVLSHERLSTLGHFSAGITHDLRNSMTVMMSLLELVQQSPGEQAVLAAAQRSFATLDALLRLASDVNALARGQAQELKRGTVEVSSFVDQTLRLFRVEPDGRSRGVDVEIAPEARILSFDPARVRQALLALLRNAAQASAPKTPIAVRVTLSPQAEACFQVRDRGRAPAVGEPRKLVLRLGRPQTQGIGLELCRVVAEAHGGRMILTPDPDHGTSAELWLSNARPALAVVEEPS